MSESGQGNSLFDEINKKISENKTKTAEESIEEKMSQRNDVFFKNKTSIEDIRNDIQDNEVTIRKAKRDENFHLRRIRANVKVDHSATLKDKLTIDHGLYDQCNSMTVSVIKMHNLSLKIPSNLFHNLRLRILELSTSA